MVRKDVSSLEGTKFKKKQTFRVFDASKPIPNAINPSFVGNTSIQLLAFLITSDSINSYRTFYFTILSNIIILYSSI